MTSVARGFFTAAIIYCLLGMLLGLHMAMTSNHSEMPTHAHIQLIGWVSFFLFGLFYLQFGQAVRPVLAVLHFWIAQAAMLGLMIGLWLVYSDHSEYEPIAAVSAMAYAVSFLVFAAAALPVIWTRRA
jgi:ABC-type methionine transport system permease subunit